MGVVHGKKRWFVYPPGIDDSSLNVTRLSKLLPVAQWMDEVYPSLQQLPKFPSFQQSRVKEKPVPGISYRPMECVQNAKDVVYIPEGWLVSDHGICM